MAMTRVQPVQIEVRADWFDGRPRELMWAGKRLPVREIVAIRDETAAFPVVTGPRTLFEVSTEIATFSLSFRHRSRRWTIEGMDQQAARAAEDHLLAVGAHELRRETIGRQSGLIRGLAGRESAVRLPSLALPPVRRPRYAGAVPEGTPFAELTLGQFNERLASAEPVPGGGSASAVAGSLAASLVTMVAELSKRPKYMDHASLHGKVEKDGRQLAARLLRLADEDADSYGAFAAAIKLPKETDDEREARSKAMRSAARSASEVPMEVLQACFEVVLAAESLAGRCNQNASSDLSVATLLAEAAAKGAAANVRVNLPSVGDEAWAAEIEHKVTDLLADIENTATSCRQTVASGGLRGPVPTGVLTEAPP